MQLPSDYEEFEEFKRDTPEETILAMLLHHGVSIKIESSRICGAHIEVSGSRFNVYQFTQAFEQLRANKVEPADVRELETRCAELETARKRLEESVQKLPPELAHSITKKIRY